MKKLLYAEAIVLSLVLALVMGMTQCKKKGIYTINNGTPVGKPVYIRLNVDKGGKHEVHPDTGVVDYGEGDKLYVGNEGKYIGTLTYHDGAFGGIIYGPQTTDYLHFYFIGGLETDEITEGVTTDFAVSIADQSENLPVLSYNHSTKKYSEGVTTYSCMLLNKCGLVKFTLTECTSKAVKVAGMKTGATVNFADPANPIIANGIKDAITLYSDSEAEKWAILLPQNEVNDALVLIDGVAYKCDVAAVMENDLITTNTVDNTTPLSEKLFTVSKNGNAVRFSSGNLQYDKTSGEYSFMEHQYDEVETEGEVVGDNYADCNIVSLFCWGTGDNPTTTSEESAEYLTFKDWGDYCGDPTGNSYHWYTLTEEEWEWLLGKKNKVDPGNTCRPGNRFLSARIFVDKSSHYGLILFPDGYDGSIGSYSYNNYTSRVDVPASDWSDMEAAGAVFLPSACRRGGVDVMHNPYYAGNYWSSTSCGSDRAYEVLFADGWLYDVSPNATALRYYGLSVRLVR